MEEETDHVKKHRRDEATSWKRLVKTKSRKQVTILFNVSNEMAERMERAGNILKQIEAIEPGKGIKQNFPGAFTKFCVNATVESIERLMESSEENNK